MIPPKQNAEFVARMEDVLDVYQWEYDESWPVVCMDEQPVQLVKEVRTPLPPSPGRTSKFDYEYERAGTANIFMFTEPLGCWRKATVRERKTMIDWAEEIHDLLTIDYPDAEKVVLVCDNLNTHRIASLYERYDPELARSLTQRLDLHFTPKHGSWLNVAECELSALTRQCLSRRIPTITALRKAVTAWMNRRNASQVGINWQFTTTDARIKLKRLYPQIEMC